MIGLAGGENVMGSAKGWVSPDVETLAASPCGDAWCWWDSLEGDLPISTWG